MTVEFIDVQILMKLPVPLLGNRLALNFLWSSWVRVGLLSRGEGWPFSGLKLALPFLVWGLAPVGPPGRGWQTVKERMERTRPRPKSKRSAEPDPTQRERMEDS